MHCQNPLSCLPPPRQELLPGERGRRVQHGVRVAASAVPAGAPHGRRDAAPGPYLPAALDHTSRHAAVVSQGDRRGKNLKGVEERRDVMDCDEICI